MLLKFLCVVFPSFFFVFFGGKNFKNFPFAALEGRKGEEEKAFSSSSEYHSLTHSLRVIKCCCFCRRNERL